MKGTFSIAVFAVSLRRLLCRAERVVGVVQGVDLALHRLGDVGSHDHM